MAGTKIDSSVLQGFLDAFNAHDVDAVMSFFTQDCVMDMPRGPGPGGRRLVGKEQVREGIQSRFDGIPDVHYGDDSHWLCGDRGVSEWTLSGTQGTGEPIEVRGCDRGSSSSTGRSAARTPSGRSSSSPMPPADVDLVREIYDRFRGGDGDGALALYHPDVEVHDRPEIPDPQVYRGHEGVLAALQASRDEFAEFDAVPEEFIEAGDRVIVLFRFVGTGRESGFPVDQRLCHAWTVRDGLVTRMEVFSTHEDALRGS